MTERTQTGLLLLFFCAIEWLFRAPVLFGPQALFQRDLMLLYFPLVQSTLRDILAGSLPLRDASSAFGQPLLADPSCQILYPPTWLHLILSPSRAYAWFVSIHSVFGAMGISLLARRLSGGSFASAAMGGCAWLASGPLQSLATLWHHQAGAAWIPWVLLATERVLARCPGRPGLFLGGAIGFQILAGSADMCAMTLLIAGLRILVAGELGLWRTWLKSGAFGVALGAGVWLPAGELVLASARSAIPESARTYWSMHPFSFLEFFLPIPISALRLAPEWRQAFFEGREPFLASMFLGVALLPLVIAALGDATLTRRVRLTLFLGAVAAVLTALGKHSVFYYGLVAAIPPLKILRYPSKAMIPATVLICVLAAIGAASVRRDGRSRKAATLTLLALACAALALSGPGLQPLSATFLDPASAEGAAELFRNLPGDLLFGIGILIVLAAYGRVKSPKAAAALFALLLAGHLRQSLGLHDGMNPVVPSATLGYKSEFVELLRPPPGGRLYVYDYWMFEGRARKYLGEASFDPADNLKSLTPDVARLVATRDYVNPLVGAFWGIEYAWDGDLRMLFDRRLAQLTTAVRRVEGTPALLRLLQISGVHRVAAMHDEGMMGLELLFRRNFYPRPLRLFAVPDPLPRAYLASGRVQGSGQDLRDLIDPGFDPRTSVVVDHGPARPASATFGGEARILESRSDRVVVETVTNAPGFLTVLEGFMPGWRVSIDRAPARLERANAIFIGTEVPEGRHLVEFRFLPTSAVAGVLLTAVCALLLLRAFVTALRSPQEG